MAFHINTDTNSDKSITVTNGDTYVSVISRGDLSRVFVGLHPDSATTLAVALLNGAANVRARKHGNYTDVQRAREALDYDGLPQEDGLYEDDAYNLYRRAQGKWYVGGAAIDGALLDNWEVSLLVHGELHRLGRV